MNATDRTTPTNSQHLQRSSHRAGWRLVGLFMAAVTFAGCSGDSVTGPAAVPTPAVQSPTSAKPDLLPGEELAVAIQTLFQNDNTNECRGELVHTEGQVNSFFHITVVDPTKYHIKVHYNTQGNTGTAVVPPFVSYKVIETDDYEEQFDASLPYENTYTTTVWLRRDGESAGTLTQPVGDDYFVHITMHFTINNNGVPTATVDNIKTDCR
jgi:hypothetical protein